ncbi:MAG: hypothetical protein EOP48_19000 [Sphingobacteriales bacterium]|nr:MAG: hypothetical protein EOP48_19000 [Sphingobacteriales bacterium]
MPTLHIIHLTHRTDRMETLVAELSQQRINNFRVCDGVTHFEHPHIGIAEAHKRLVKLAKDNLWPKILIAEDDVKFAAPGAFDFYLAGEPKDADLYLGGITYGIVKAGNIVEDFAGLTLYIIYARFYDTFLNIPQEEHLDRGLRHKGTYIVCNPMIALQHPGYSDNHQKMVNYNSCFKTLPVFNKSS